MKKAILPVMLVALLVNACSKETDSIPFSPKGMWHGYMYYFSVSILNRDNGTARLYVGSFEGDTTRGVIGKFEGYYTATVNSYRGMFDFNSDSISFRSNMATGTNMEGRASALNAGQAFDFKLAKQP